MVGKKVTQRFGRGYIQGCAADLGNESMFTKGPVPSQFRKNKKSRWCKFWFQRQWDPRLVSGPRPVKTNLGITHVPHLCQYICIFNKLRKGEKSSTCCWWCCLLAEWRIPLIMKAVPVLPLQLAHLKSCQLPDMLKLWPRTVYGRVTRPVTAASTLSISTSM